MDVTFTHLKKLCLQSHTKNSISPKINGRMLLTLKLLKHPTIFKNILTKFKGINTVLKKMFGCFRKGKTEDTKILYKEIVYLYY